MQHEASLRKSLDEVFSVPTLEGDNAMEDAARIGVGAAAGAATGSLIVYSMTSLTPELVSISASAGAVIGMLASLTLIAVRTSRQSPSIPFTRKKRNRVSPSLRHRRTKRKAEPRPFRQRLASFTHQDETDTMDKSKAFESKMPFWSINGFLSRVPPKSASLIRYYLVAIRKAVSKSSESR